MGQRADFSAVTHFPGSWRARAAVNQAPGRSLRGCSEAEKHRNKQARCLPPLHSSSPPHASLLALLRVKSPSSCLTLLREHDRHPCHWKCLQQSDAPNLSSRQVNLWIIYFYALPEDVDSSRHVHHARPVFGGAGPAAPTVTVNELEGWVLRAPSSSPPGPGPRHHQGPIRNMIMDLTLNQTGLPLVPFGQEAA